MRRTPIFLLLLLTSATLAQATTQPDLAVILKNLASDNFATREAAQKQLDSLNYKFRGTLAKLADQHSDPEVKARLQSRIAAIDEQLAIDPPPISLDFKDATSEQVVAALNKAMGTNIRFVPVAGTDPNKRWTLSVTEMPFWEVIVELNRQHGWAISNSDTGMVMYDQEPGFSSYTRGGGIVIYPSAIERGASFFPQRPPGVQRTPTGMSFSCTVVIDPRMKLESYSQPQFAEITDDAGNVLYKPKPAELPGMSSPSRGQIATFSTGAPLDIPEKLGKQIPIIKGTFTVNVLLSQQTLTLQNAEKQVGQSCTLAGRVFTLESLDPSPDHFEMKINLKNAPGEPLSPNMPPVTMKLTDAKGKVHWEVPLTTGTNNVFKNAQDVTLPLKLEFTAPAKTRQITIPFEFKNLLLP